MNIVYHPMAIGAAVPAVPAGAIPWVAMPFQATPKVAMTTADMALALRKDIDPGGVIPFFLTGGLQQVFEAMYPTEAIDDLDMLVANPFFSGVPGNWLSVFSQMVAAATSLAVAEKVEGYPFCLSMQFCKVNAAAPGVGPCARSVAACVLARDSTNVARAAYRCRHDAGLRDRQAKRGGSV